MKTSNEKLSIGKVIREALAFDPKNWGKSKLDSEAMPAAVRALFDLLESRQINYVLVGGVAMLSYLQGRNTSDIDLIMAVSSLKKIPEIEIDTKEAFFARGKFQGLQIDLLFTKNPLFELVSQEHCQPQTFLERTIPVASVTGLLLLKLYALPSLYRQGDFAKVGIYENDIASLLYEYSSESGELIEVLAKYLDPNDVEEIKAILMELHARIGKFKQKRNE